MLTLPEGAVDLVSSSLTLLAEVHRGLVPGGRFVFSVEHPMYTAPSKPDWRTDGDRRVWPVDRYLDQGPRTTDWLTKGVVKQHRTVATYVNLLLECSFALLRIEEWGPTDAQVSARPEWACERPPFLLVSARR